jgi:hypothetical protein
VSLLRRRVAAALCALALAGCGRCGRPRTARSDPGGEGSAAADASAAGAAPDFGPPLEEPVPEDLPPPLYVESSAGGLAVVDLERGDVDPRGEELTRLTLVDGRGARAAVRLGVRRACIRVCEDDQQPTCHTVGDYRFSGPALEPFALAFPPDVEVEPAPLRCSQLHSEADRTARIARVFADGYDAVDERSYYTGWSLDPATGEWIQRSRFEGYERATGNGVADCAVRACEALTEVRCGVSAAVHAGHTFVSLNQEQERTLRYALRVEGVQAWVVLETVSETTFPGLLFRGGDGWRRQPVGSASFQECYRDGGH